jgi:hypothetical protein
MRRYQLFVMFVTNIIRLSLHLVVMIVKSTDNSKLYFYNSNATVSFFLLVLLLGLSKSQQVVDYRVFRHFNILFGKDFIKFFLKE